MIMLTAASVSAQDPLLAFPGAEGFGRFATGGRGGEIYHVTNLNDSGTGSLRDAVSKPNRIIVFDVSGVIHLKSRLSFKSNLTVLGQTAPGEGVQVYGNGVSFSDANNIIVRYLRVRMGVNGDSGKDTAGVASGHDMAGRAIISERPAAGSIGFTLAKGVYVIAVDGMPPVKIAVL